VAFGFFDCAEALANSRTHTVVISISLISVPPWNTRVRFGQAALYINENEKEGPEPGHGLGERLGGKSKAADRSVRSPLCVPLTISIVAEGGGALGKVPQIGLVLLVEKGVLGGGTVGDGFEILGESGNS
jgi:hypothetical protein